MWKLLQGCHALRNEMAHLCSRLQAYLMFEVLERAWLDLTHSLKSVGHLDDLIGEADCTLACLPQRSSLSYSKLCRWHVLAQWHLWSFEAGLVTGRRRKGGCICWVSALAELEDPCGCRGA